MKTGIAVNDVLSEVSHYRVIGRLYVFEIS